MKQRARHKFNAVKTKRDGITFDSKLEASYYDWLKLQEQAGTLLFFSQAVAVSFAGWYQAGD